MPDPTSVRSRRAIDERVARLRDAHAPFPLHTETVENDPDRFEQGRDFFEGGGRGGAGARVTDEDGRLLMIRHPRAPETWTLPSGGHESGESFAETAVREVREETGVECEITGVWQAVHRRFVHANDPERRGYLLSVLFTAEVVGGDAGLCPDRWDDAEGEEILAVDWFDEPPENTAAHATDPTVPE